MTDYEDYENNLAFPPTTDRTQYDRHHQVVNGNNEWESEVMLDCGVKADYALKKIKELDK